MSGRLQQTRERTNQDEGAMVRILHAHEIPILDLGSYHSSKEQHTALLDGMKESLDTLGFLVLENHGVDLELLSRCYEHSKRFFALPDETKRELDYRIIDQKKYSNIGYFPFQEEKALSSKIPDLKEFFHVGPEVPEDLKAYYGENRWPRGRTGFEADSRELFRQFMECGNRIFLALAEVLQINMDYAHTLVHGSNSILRYLHYPAIPEGVTPGAMRAAQHTGIQLLGLQPQTTHAGLQFHLPTGEWVALASDVQKGRLAINIGEMFAYLVGNRARPTLHRVVNAMDGSEHEDRYAIVFFFHAGHLQTVRSPETGESVRAGDWLLQRLEELDLHLPGKKAT